MRRLMMPAALTLPLALLLSSCTQTGGGSRDSAKADGRTITVESSDDACTLSATSGPSGSLTFEVSNTGSDVTEFYLYADGGDRIVSEVENIGPGLERELVVAIKPGDYIAACKPGMRGDGIRVDFEVTDSGETVSAPDDTALIEQAEEGYEQYVESESAALVAATEEFVTAYTAGQDDRARTLYPQARTHWERIETVAESFADLDPLLDAREADLEPGQRWTGWHRLEKDLWPERAEDYRTLTSRQRQVLADHLLTKTDELDGRIRDLDITVDQITNGSRGLMEEVATGKITGEEEYWSRTDLWDFQANVDGAKAAFELLAPVVAGRDAELEESLDERFDALQELLDKHRVGDGFRPYDDLTQAEIKSLADAVNALSEPLSELTAVVAS
ncbi:MAG: cupredoxin domain-containing protein [Nocardioidaceae bacterium]|nr:cupredoxin domain-containing protein [Nocardioidaceae bacterium]